MKYIVKREPGCNGKSCLLCEDYLPGFITTEGGIAIVSEPAEIDGALMAELFCPQQVISMEAYINE